ncbi:Glutamine synthetase [uncultured archaeon]|nr:Glutamine synthetase [uncultured archaeon]
MTETEITAAKKKLKDSQTKNVMCVFTDIRGILQSFTKPVSVFTEGDAFSDGIGFDGSSIRGFKTIENSDMIWMPDANTLQVIPWTTDPIQKSALLFGNVLEAFAAKDGGAQATCDPRGYVATRAMDEAKKMGYTAVFGPEIEFFVFESADPSKLNYDLWVSPNGGAGDSWGPPRVVPQSPEIRPGGYVLRPKEAYFRAPPEDPTNEFRNELAHNLNEMGVPVECHHHEVATCGQVEFPYKAAELTASADRFYKYKFTARNIAKKYGWMAVFMPKPIYLDNASGMHTHQSLWEGEPFKGKAAFSDPNDEWGLSQTARYYIGGLLEHARALTAVTCPTVNSYKRLVPGFEAPVNICWSPRNRSALIRVPAYHKNPKATRAEYRGCDPSCNPYLAFSVMLAAGLDGIKKKIDPGDPLLHDVYEMSAREKHEHGVGELPTTLRDALEALASDEVLQDALGSHVFDKFIEYKMDDWNQFCLYVTPWEYMKYLDY